MNVNVTGKLCNIAVVKLYDDGVVQAETFAYLIYTGEFLDPFYDAL